MSAASSVISIPRVILGPQKSPYGFRSGPGTDFRYGSEPELARRLDALAKGEHLVIWGISGHRTPAHSVAVGGFANDPHTRGEAADIGVNSQLRSSAARLSEATLRKYGLTRPFGGAAEVNHVQLLPGWKGATSTGPIGNPIDVAKGPVEGVIDAGKAAAELSGTVVDFVKDPTRGLLYLLLLSVGGGLAVYGLVHALGVDTRVREGAQRTAELAAVIK